MHHMPHSADICAHALPATHIPFCYSPILHSTFCVPTHTSCLPLPTTPTPCPTTWPLPTLTGTRLFRLLFFILHWLFGCSVVDSHHTPPHTTLHTRTYPHHPRATTPTPHLPAYLGIMSDSCLNMSLWNKATGSPHTTALTTRERAAFAAATRRAWATRFVVVCRCCIAQLVSLC